MEDRSMLNGCGSDREIQNRKRAGKKGKNLISKEI